MTKNKKKWFELGPFTIFDVETTGMSPVNNRIVEIAAVRVNNDGMQDRYHSLVNPGVIMSDSIIRIHNISNEMVADAPDFSVVGKEFTEFAENSTLVAHNARFDLGFLQESLFRSGLPLWEGKTLDSIPLIKRAFPDLPSYSLQNLKQRFALGEGTGQAHRAFDDVEWTLEVLEMTFNALLRGCQ